MNIYKLAHKFLEQFKLNSISKSLNSGAYNQLRYFQSNALAFKTVKIKNISVKNIAITMMLYAKINKDESPWESGMPGWGLENIRTGN